MDHERVGGEVFGEIVTLDRVDLQLAPGVLREPAGDLHPPDVVGYGVVAARLGDEDAVARPQALDGQRSLHLRGEIALEAGEEDGEAGHGDLAGRVGSHLEEGLGVGDHQPRWPVEPLQGALELPFFDHEGHGVGVEQVADGLDLGQDQAALGRLLVDGHHQHGQLSRSHQVAEDGRALDEVLRGVVQQGLAEVEDTLPLHGRGEHHGQL